jgi:membrane protein implicated in regulation of membrane protease activity
VRTFWYVLLRVAVLVVAAKFFFDGPWFVSVVALALAVLANIIIHRYVEPLDG